MSAMVIREFADADEDQVVPLWGPLRPSAAVERSAGGTSRASARCNENLFLVAVVDAGIVGAVMAGYEGHRAGSITWRWIPRTAGGAWAAR
jgi:hypothetical protein